ncbi:MAG: glycosyltransferase family 4 protein [Burkholderiales bacterium]|jgi:glycosyltransferase involved in cell wall biosynthesis|nr:glycosyltransferase family 4 protein [Burkholderiales bacterium]
MELSPHGSVKNARFFEGAALRSFSCLQIVRSMSFGGAENHVLQLSLGLQQKGWAVTVVCPAGSWVAKRCPEYGLRHLPVAMRGLFDLTSYIKLHRAIKDAHTDIVHAHQVRPSQYAGVAAINTGAIPIATAHSTKAVKHMRRCRHLIAVSDAVKNNLIAHGYAPHKITRIYNGVTPPPEEDRLSLRRELHIPQDVFAIVLSGRFVVDKGQDLLLQTLERLPETAHYYLIGDTHTDFGRGLVARYGNHPRVHFLGYRSDAPRLLSAFDLYCAPSRREAFSLSILEACAARLPVVGAEVGGIPEAVIDQKTGLIVAPNNSDALAEAILSLWNDRAKAKRMGNNARAYYEQHFTVQHMVDETEKLYHALLEDAESQKTAIRDQM